MPASPEKRREIRRRHAAKRKARDPEADQFRERIKTQRQRMLARSRRALVWAEHGRTCPVCVSTLAAGSGDALPIGGGARRRILRKVARSELGRAASVGLGAGLDPLANQVRIFLQALCPEGQRLLLPVLTSGGQAAVPGTETKAMGLLYDLAEVPEERPDLFYARWARRDFLEDPLYMDAPATLEVAFEEWAWYEHRWPHKRLAGKEEANRCIFAAELTTTAIAPLSPEAHANW